MCFVALTSLVTSCAATATAPRLQVPPQPGVETTYQRGAPLLHSTRVNRVILKLIDRDEEELLLGLAVRNGQAEAFEISTDDVRLTAGRAGGEFLAAHIYSFEELPREEDASLAWDGAQAAAGVAALPIGGIWGSLAQTMMRLGVRATRPTGPDGAATKVLVPTIETAYLQRHTVAPGEEYRGLFVVELPRDPETGDDLRVNVTAGEEGHTFVLQFAAP